jgi:hypothetical protein
MKAFSARCVRLAFDKVKKEDFWIARKFDVMPTSPITACWKIKPVEHQMPVFSK